MTGRVLTALGLVVTAAAPAAAAPAVTVKVGGNGNLEIPPAVVKKLGIKQKRGQLICVQFPRPPARKPAGGGPRGPVPTRPPRIYTALGNNGRLTITRVPGQTSAGSIPGKPGTVYRATNRGGVLVLTRLK